MSEQLADLSAWMICLALLGLAIDLLCAVYGYRIASEKNAGVFGLVFGLLLGPFGLLLAMLADEREKCPLCRGRVGGEATLCPSCRSKLTWRDGKIVSARETVSVVIAKTAPPAAVD